MSDIVSEVISYRKHAGDVLVPAHHTAPRVGVPLRAKELATKFLSADHRERRARISEIYEEGLGVETAVVVRFRDRTAFRDYVEMMYEEDQYQTTKKLMEEGDGGVALT